MPYTSMEPYNQVMSVINGKPHKINIKKEKRSWADVYHGGFSCLLQLGTQSLRVRDVDVPHVMK